MRFIAIACLLAAFFSSCNPYKKEVPARPPKRVENVYSNPSYDFARLRNVLLLPVHNPLDNRSVSLHGERFARALLNNFGKFNYFSIQYDPKFEFAPGKILDLDQERMDRVTLGAAGKFYGANAIMQISIQDYQPFEPIHMKVKAALVDADTGERIWAVDHVFDANDAGTISAMKVWWNSERAGGLKEDFEMRTNDFNDFVFYSVAQTFMQERIASAQAIEAMKKAEVPREHVVQRTGQSKEYEALLEDYEQEIKRERKEAREKALKEAEETLANTIPEVPEEVPPVPDENEFAQQSSDPVETRQMEQEELERVFKERKARLPSRYIRGSKSFDRPVAEKAKAEDEPKKPVARRNAMLDKGKEVLNGPKEQDSYEEEWNR